MNTVASVLYDAVIVPGGPAELANDGLAVNFAAEAFKHGKAVGAFGTGLGLLQRAQIPLTTASVDPALVTYDDWTEAFVDDFAAALAAHRNFDRDVTAVPA
jgi:catalase